MNVIESVNNEKVKLWCKLKQNKYIKEYGIYLVEGYHLVEEAIKNNKIEYLIVLNSISYDSDLPIYYVNKKVMEKITNLKSIPPVIGVVKVGHNNILSNKVLMLDDVQDPGNLGTLIRSASAFNFNTVLLTNGCASEYNDKVIRASEGNIFNINIIRDNKVELFNLLLENNYNIYSCSMEGNININDISNNKLCLILGSEGQGVSREALNKSKGTVSIEMDSKCESLNVAVAGSILMYMKRD